MGKLYIISSTLMAALFIASATVQFNDPEWYFWIPVYACAAYVNLVSCWACLPLTGLKALNKGTLWLAGYLLSQLLLDDYFDDFAGFWSFDLTQIVVREKLGSLLVILSMKLQASAAQVFQQDPSKRKNMQVGPIIRYGAAILMVISYGLSAVFLAY